MRVVLDLQVFALEQKIDQVLLHCCHAQFHDLQQSTVSSKHRATLCACSFGGVRTLSSGGAASSGRAVPQDPPLRLALDDTQQVGVLLGRPPRQAEGHVTAGRVDAGGQGYLLLVLQSLLYSQLPHSFLLAGIPVHNKQCFTSLDKVWVVLLQLLK